MDRLLSDLRPVARKRHVCNAWPIIKDALSESQVTFSFSDLRIIAKYHRRGEAFIFIEEGEKHVHQTIVTENGCTTLYVNHEGQVMRRYSNRLYRFRAKEDLHRICLEYDLYSTN